MVIVDSKVGGLGQKSLLPVVRHSLRTLKSI